MSGLLESISVFEDRARRLEQRLADPAVASAPGEYAQVAKELAGLRPLVDAGARYRAALAQSADARSLQSDPDPEVSELARAELEALEARTLALERELRLLLVPKDPNDEKNVMLEVRAGTGGDEAALFAAELLRMYTRYAERRGWKLEPLSISQSTGRRRQGGGRRDQRGSASTAGSSTSAACTACSACPRPRRRGASIPRR